MMSQKRLGIILSYANLIAKNMVTFIYTPILLRFLGQSEYGLYQMANSVITSLTLLNLGFGSAYIRFYARTRSEKNNQKLAELNGLYLIIFLILSLVSIVAGFFMVINIGTIFGHSLTVNEINTTRYLMILMVLNVALSFPSSVFDSNIIAHEQFRFQRSRQLFQTIITPILTLPLLAIGMKSISIVIVQTVITLFFFALNMKFSIINLHMKFRFSNMDFSLIKEISIFSFFIFLNQIIDQINWNLPNFLLGILSGAKQVAIFAVANQIKNIFITLSTSLSGVFVPEINNIVSTTDDNDELTRIMTKVGKMQMIILTYTLGGFILLGKYFITVWAGKSYIEAYTLSLLLIIPFLVTLIQNTGYEIIRAKNMHQFRAVIEFIFALGNIGLTVFFIKYFGLIGSAMGTMVTMISVSWIIMNWFYLKKVKLNMLYFWKEIIKVSPPSILALSITSIIKQFFPVNSIMTFIIYGVLFSLIYLVILYFVTSKVEKEVVISLFKKRKKGGN